jgi:hypothetical protein
VTRFRGRTGAQELVDEPFVPLGLAPVHPVPVRRGVAPARKDAAFRAAGIRFSGLPAPAGELSLPHVRPTGRPCLPDPNGVVTFRLVAVQPGVGAAVVQKGRGHPVHAAVAGAVVAGHGHCGGDDPDLDASDDRRERPVGQVSEYGQAPGGGEPGQELRFRRGDGGPEVPLSKPRSVSSSMVASSSGTQVLFLRTSRFAEKLAGSGSRAVRRLSVRAPAEGVDVGPPGRGMQPSAGALVAVAPLEIVGQRSRLLRLHQELHESPQPGVGCERTCGWNSAKHRQSGRSRWASSRSGTAACDRPGPLRPPR